MSSCNKISQLLSAYVDGEISASEKEMVEKHIENCTSCKQKLEVMIKTKDILKAAPQIPVPETLLKDFEEYRKKSEQTEKKVVPFYKNYRIYASVAAIFIFAFVLKSGLWQEDKFVPDNLTQSKVTEQSIDAPVDNNEDVTSTEEKSEATNDKAVADNQEIQQKSVKPATSTEESAAVPQPETTQIVAKSVAKAVPETSQEPLENTPAVAEVPADQATPETAAYDETQSSFAMPRTVNEPAAEEAEAPAHAIVYVSEEHLAKAAKLLSEGEYFYAQVEQKLSDNRIPFESNYLSLDEGVPHKVVVMVKE